MKARTTARKKTGTKTRAPKKGAKAGWTDWTGGPEMYFVPFLAVLVIAAIGAQIVWKSRDRTEDWRAPASSSYLGAPDDDTDYGPRRTRPGAIFAD